MPSDLSPPVGKAYLVGAGPGDPGMLTLRGVECLRRADVVLYDYLVNREILRFANEHAEQICLGQHGKTRIWTQAEINEALVNRGLAGQQVVRLKGGDPTIFARGSEELGALQAAGIPWEVVPGVTAATAVASCAGISLTDRDQASAVALITGQESCDKRKPAMDYQGLANFPGTLVFYMGVTTARTWTRQLLLAGKSPDTAAAIVRRCSLPDQQTIYCRLDEIADRVAAAEIRPPAMIILGEVTRSMAHPCWFEGRPLFGVRILITRPLDQLDQLRQPLMELGADVLTHPMIRIDPPESWAPVDQACSDFSQYDWLVFSSANGVRFLLDRLRATGKDARALGNLRIAAIGPGTARELRRFHLDADLQPGEFRAESLAAELVQGAAEQRFLLARASRGREVLAEQLRAAGGIVDQVVVYRSSDARQIQPDIQQQLALGQIDWVTVTSSAIARALVRLAGPLLGKCKLASISPLTSSTLRECGFEPQAEAREYTMPGVVQAIREAVAA
ncbi:MAG: uroporphyrinogen-III C-methyltransferase [Planctomycetaceae bacterium]|nr:uroporphyrinogen-III C-methyltransferase [Planctomycetaceae bacterium]